MTTKEIWKPVTISGVTGILMGAGTMYAIENASSGEMAGGNNVEPLKVSSVDDSLSFGQAFEAARAEVGPGGVFRWHGNIYNTYTAEEWRSMSQQSQNQFAERVKPEISPADINAGEIGSVEQVEKPLLAENQDVQVQEETTQTVAANHEVKSEDDDVRVVGFGHVEIAEGRYVAVEEVDINGQRVAIIDVDNDGVADVAMSDVNHNGQADNGEIIDLHTGESLAFTNSDTPTNEGMDVMADYEQSVDDGSEMMSFNI